MRCRNLAVASGCLAPVLEHTPISNIYLPYSWKSQNPQKSKKTRKPQMKWPEGGRQPYRSFEVLINFWSSCVHAFGPLGRVGGRRRRAKTSPTSLIPHLTSFSLLSLEGSMEKPKMLPVVAGAALGVAAMMIFRRMTKYTPPAVWKWNKPNGGKFANINKPTAVLPNPNVPLCQKLCPPTIAWSQMEGQNNFSHTVFCCCFHLGSQGAQQEMTLPVGDHPLQLYSLVLLLELVLSVVYEAHP